MATPVFKFNHPKSKEDFYFLHDTYYELPKTIPMCLATFVYYHLKINRTLSGFVMSFEDINKTGASLIDTSFDEFYNEKEIDFLYNQIEDTGALENAEILSKDSTKIRAFFTSDNESNISVEDFINENMIDTIFEFRGVNYYNSLSNLYSEVSKINEEHGELPF